LSNSVVGAAWSCTERVSISDAWRQENRIFKVKL
jgi:hypothetical protein